MDEEVFSYLMRFIDGEGDVRWLSTAVEFADTDEYQLPDRWRVALNGKSSLRQQLAALWSEVAHVLPRTVSAILDKCAGVSLLYTNDTGVSLVYIFRLEDEFTAWRGFAPTRTLPPLAAQFPVDLLPLWSLHDGFVRLSSNDGGPMPVSRWQALVDPATERLSLVKIAVDGTTAFGFDLSESPSLAYAVKPDGNDVELVEDVWEFLDDMMAGPIESL